MTKEHYFNGLSRLEKQLRDKPWIADRSMLSAFTYMSANLQHFLPMLDMQCHQDIFLRFQLEQWRNAMDTKFFAETYPFRVEGWLGLKKQLQQRPGLLCTFHFGAYQLINYLLVKAEVPFALLVAGEVRQSWQRRYPGLLEALDEAERLGRFVLLDANQAASLRRLIQLARGGWTLLIYADGLEGLTSSHRERLATFPFLGQQVSAPYGAIQIAHQLQLPIYAMLALRYDKSVSLKTYMAAQIASVDKQAMAKDTVADLYRWLSSYLIHWPEQWTNWPHVHLIRSTQRPLAGKLWKPTGMPMDVQRQEYGLLYEDDSYLVLRKRDMASFVIDRKDYLTLRREWYGK